MNPVVVKKGTNIITSKPFAFALYAHCRTEYCDHCFKSNGLSLATSAIHHSCEPNVHILFDKTTMIIRTLQDFPNFEFSQLRKSYVETLQTAEERNAVLMEQYYFVCDCPSCAKPELKHLAAACQNHSCTNLCKATDKQCSACGHEFPPDFAKTYAEVVEFLRENNEDAARSDDWDLIEKCLKKQQGILHPMNVHYVATLNCASQVAFGLHYWEKAEMFSTLGIEGYLEYYGKYSAEVGILYSILGMSQVNLGKVCEATRTANKAKSIMKVAYGEEHPAYKNYVGTLLYLIQKKKGHKV